MTYPSPEQIAEAQRFIDALPDEDERETEPVRGSANALIDSLLKAAIESYGTERIVELLMEDPRAASHAAKVLNDKTYDKMVIMKHQFAGMEKRVFQMLEREER